MQVDAISFSAHADFPQTSEFLDTLQVRATRMLAFTLHPTSLDLHMRPILLPVPRALLPS